MDFSILDRLLWFVVAISVLVAAHEFGHYWVARRLGFKVLRFSIGFGRPLIAWRGPAPDHVEYWLSAIPLGGYVKMLDEREEAVPTAERHRAFNHRPIWQRIAVLLAGPAFNFLFAIVAYWLMFATGVPALKPLISSVVPDSAADVAGVRAGDEVEAVAGKPVATWEDATLRIFDELLGDGRIELTLRDLGGEVRQADLDVRGRTAELTEPAALFEGLGFKPGPVANAIIGAVTPGAPAEAAGLKPGDEIIRGGDEPIDSWEQWVGFIRQRPGETVTFTVLRGGAELERTVTIGSVVDGERTIGRIGASSPSLLEEQRYGIFESLPRGAQKTWEVSAFTVTMITHMVTGEVSLKNMSGPLSIADFAGDSAAAGLPFFLSFLAAVSISLGILNLLPIPLLDGGQVVYQLLEWIKGSPLSERALAVGQQIGILFVVALTGFAFYNDIVRMFGS